jgi:two-component system response regulator AtoC
MTEFLLRKHTPPGLAVPVLTPALRQEFLTYRWPGNIRELENLIRRLIILRNPDMIINDMRSRALRKNSVLMMSPRESIAGNGCVAEPGTPILEKVSRAKEQAEAEAILAALNATHWNRKQAAALLKIDYKALLYKLKKLAIEEKAEPADDLAGPERTMAAGAGGGKEQPTWTAERQEK